jgi:hypothetical protein
MFDIWIGPELGRISAIAQDKSFGDSMPQRWQRSFLLEDLKIQDQDRYERSNEKPITRLTL